MFHYRVKSFPRSCSIENIHSPGKKMMPCELTAVTLSCNSESYSEVHYNLKKFQKMRFFYAIIHHKIIKYIELKRKSIERNRIKGMIITCVHIFFSYFSANSLANHLTSHPTVLIRHFEFIVAGIHPRISGCVVMFIEKKGVNELSTF